MTRMIGKQYYEMPVYKDITDLFEQTLEKSAGDYAITYRDTPKDDPINLTYRELADNLDAIRLAWSAKGLTNQRLAIVGANSYFWIASYLAAAKCQDLLIPIDNLLTIEELDSLLERSRADMLCIDLKSLLKFKDDPSRLEKLKFIQVMNQYSATEKDKKALADLLDRLHNVEVCFFEDLIDQGYTAKERGDSLVYQPQDPEEASILIFTSGTTAMSKGVLLKQSSIVYDVAALKGMVSFPQKMRSLSLLPLNHTFESTCGMLGVIAVGGHIHIYDGLRYVQKNLQEYQIQIFIGVPAIFDSFYNKIMTQIKKQKKEKLIKFAMGLSKFLRKIGIDKRREIFKEILNSLGNPEIFIIGAAPMDKQQIEFFDGIGIKALEGYGLTETSPVALANNDFVFEPGTIGQPLPGIEAKLDTGEPGEPAELMVRGPIVMTGYYEDPEATAEALTEGGWFRTGDLATFDPKNQCYTITGRKKSMIVLSNGKKVFPEEIETLIKEQKLAMIKNTMVFNQKADNNHSILSVKFVLNQDASAGGQEDTAEREAEVKRTLDQLLDNINAKMPDFKRIKAYIYSYKDMISTSTLKVKRNAESSRLEEMKDKLHLRWDDINGKNIDPYEAQLKTV